MSFEFVPLMAHRVTNFLIRHEKIVIVLFLAVVTLAVFWPVLHHDFIYYDDYAYIVENPHVAGGLSLDGIRWVLPADWASDSPYADFWIPATYLSHQLTVQWFGLNPSGHHLVNLGIHLANTLLLFLFLQSATHAAWPAAGVAALFAVHPLHVESVAWVTERKDVLSTMFWLLTFFAYARYVKRPGVARYGVVTVSFIFGLMAKPMVVTLPLVLLLMDFWPLNRLRWEDMTDPDGFPRVWRMVKEKLPLFLLSAAAAAVTLRTVNQGGGIVPIGSLPLLDRLQNSLISYVSYLGKTLWPADLAVFYPHPVSGWPLWQTIGSGLLLCAGTILVIRSAGQRPYLMAGWFWFLGTLVPVIGLVQAGGQAMADRYTYIPLIGIFIMAAYGAADLAGKWPLSKTWLAMAAVSIVIILAAVSRVQVEVWMDSRSLFEHAVRVTDRNFMAYNGLGIFHQNQGNLDAAREHYEKALEIQPNFSEAHNNLGTIHQQKGESDRAEEEYREAVRLKPDFPRVHFNLGNLYKDQGKLEEALQAYRSAEALRPDFPGLHNNMGNVFIQQGLLAEAEAAFRRGLEFWPGDPRAHNNLGIVYKAMGYWEGAAKEYREALKVDPAYAMAHYNLGNLYGERGQLEEAVRSYQEAIRSDPEFSQAHYNLAALYGRLGKFEEAGVEREAALTLNPDLKTNHGKTEPQ